MSDPHPLLALLDGAVDLHRHGYPEISDSIRPPLGDVEDVTLCRDAGMRAVVLKSHIWPTVGRADLLNQLVPGIEVVASVTLNQFAGGMRPEVVEMAARQGARAVFLPTLGAANDLERQGISSVIAQHVASYEPDPATGTRLLDAAGKLTGEALECLAVIVERDLLTFTGHLSPRESFALAESGVLGDRLVLAHPDSKSVGSDLAATVELARQGCYVEICALGAYPEIGRITHEGLAEIVTAVGPDRCVMTSDYFFSWSPPSHRMLLDLAEGLLAAGIAYDDLVTMLTRNPQHLLGMTG